MLRMYILLLDHFDVKKSSEFIFIKRYLIMNIYDRIILKFIMLLPEIVYYLANKKHRLKC